MKNSNNIIYAAFGAILGSFIVWFFLINIINSSDISMMKMMGVRNPAIADNFQNRSRNNIDKHFIEQMIPHHEDAILMSKIALEKAEHQEIKELAENIITAQQKEIEEMKNNYKKWFGADPKINSSSWNTHGMMSNRMHMGMIGDEHDLEILKNTNNFDKVFIEQMILHHQMAVMMAQMLKNSTTRTEMKQLADNIITTQTKEIEQMRQWYKEWYLIK